MSANQSTASFTSNLATCESGLQSAVGRRSISITMPEFRLGIQSFCWFYTGEKPFGIKTVDNIDFNQNTLSNLAPTHTKVGYDVHLVLSKLT